MSDETKNPMNDHDPEGPMTPEEIADRLFEQVDEMASAGMVVQLTEEQAMDLGIDTFSPQPMSLEDAMDGRFDDEAP